MSTKNLTNATDAINVNAETKLLSLSHDVTYRSQISGLAKGCEWENGESRVTGK